MNWKNLVVHAEMILCNDGTASMVHLVQSLMV